MGEGRERDRDLTLYDLVERFLEERPTNVEGFIQSHPEHAHELREMLSALGELDAAADALRSCSLADRLSALERWREAREQLAKGVSLGQDTPARKTVGSGSAHDFVARILARVEAHGYSTGRFEPAGELAHGGQGVVLAVWDETLRRHLAMKVALAPAANPPPASDTRSLGRFLEEAQVTAQLDHPGIVPVHDLGLDAERRVYFTMKLVKGRDLRAIFELVHTGTEGWNLTRALGVLLKVCEAMAYAHSKGVIHRDLKPSNVMVGKYGEVYVMDWGLARVLGSEDRKDIRIQPALTSAMRSARLETDEDSDSPLVTMDGEVVGTPAFMPPEQARGELEAIGPHSDVYAVGAMLYQLLTGAMPYLPGGSRLSNRAIWALVQEGPPEPVHELAAGAPAELVAICEKAMSREVTSRYRDMSELAEDLRAYLEHRVVSAYETGALAELRKWIRRNRRLAGTIAVAALLLATLTLVYFRSLSVYATDLSESNRSLRATALASASLEAAGSDSLLSLLLAREAVRTDETLETLSQVHRAVGEVRERAILEHEDQVFETAISPRGDVLLAKENTRAILWDLQGKRLAHLEHDGPITMQPLFFSGGDRILTVSMDGTARIWDHAGRELVRLEHDGQAVLACALSPDESLVLTGAQDGIVRLWTREGEPLLDWKAHEGKVLDVALSPSGELLLTGSADRKAVLWRLDEVTLRVAHLADLAHAGPVTGVRFSARGDRSLTVSGIGRPNNIQYQSEGKAKLWDAAGNPIATLENIGGMIEWADFWLSCRFSGSADVIGARAAG